MSKIEITIQPYMKHLPPVRVEAYQSKPGSLFAVAKLGKSWSLRHVESGLGVGAMLPPKAYSKAQLLSVIKAWEAHSELEMSSFEGLEFGVGFVKPPPLGLVESLMEIARIALA